jgi:hypothetical protein
VNGDDQPDFVTVGGAGVAIHTQLPPGEVSPSFIDVYVNGRRSVEVTPGSGLVFFGRFGFPDGGCSRQEIVLTRAKDGEGPVQVARITSVPDFGANDQFFYEGAAPTTPGHYTYAAVYPGDSEHSSAVASVDVSVSRYPSQLELRADPGRVRFRGSTHVTVRIAALDGSNRAVELFATPHRHATSSIGTVIVDRDGRGSTVVSDLTRNTVITAEWEGDATYAPEHDSTTVRVYARATGRLTNAQTTSRKYRLYREGRNIEYEAKVAPNHAGDDVRMTLEVFYRRRWRNLDSYWFRLRRDSTATLRLETRGAPLDIPFRIRARYPEGNGNLADDSAWSYFKIVR